MANQEFYQGLDDETQKLIEEAADVAYDHIIEYQKNVSEQELKKIKEAKPEMTITELSEEQRQCFKDAAEEVEAKFIEMTGDSGKAILEQMKEDLKATDPGA